MADVTITIASPAVVSWTAHGLLWNRGVSFKTTGALPTGLAVNTEYYVKGNQGTVTTPVASPGVVNWTGHGLVEGSPFKISGGTLPAPLSGLGSTVYYVKYVDANSFQLSDTVGGTALNFTGTSSGTQTGVGMPLDTFKVSATVNGTDINTSGSQSGTQSCVSSDGNDTLGRSTPVALTSISNASPAVCTKTAHGLVEYDEIEFTTTGTLPSPLLTNTKYFVKYVDADTFQIASSIASGAPSTAINTTTAGSGTHSFTKVLSGRLGGQSVTLSNVPLAVLVTLTNIVTGSRCRVARNDTNEELSSGTESGGIFTFVTKYQGLVNISVRKASSGTKYIPFETTAVIGASGLNFRVTQIVDPVAI